MIEEKDAEALEERSTEVTTQLALTEIVEALLFASDEPVTFQTVRIVCDEMNRDVPENEQVTISADQLRAAVDSLNAEYAESRRAFRIQALAGGYVFATEKRYAVWVGKLLREKARRRLSQTAVETLAIIAYKQPISKSEIEFIRGVNADYVLKTLLEKNLTTIVGRAHSPGRPLLYGTTPEFLRHFGLNEITDLPRPREIEELLGETEREVEKRMLANQQEIEFKEKLQEKLDPNSRAPHIPRKKSKLQEDTSVGKGPTVVEKAPPILPRPSPEEEPIAEKGPIEKSLPPAVENSETEVGEPAVVAPESPQIAEVALPPAGLVETSAEPPVQVPEMNPEPEPSLTPEFNPPPATSATVAAEEAAESLRHDEPGLKKGWSSWKSKIQSFLRKLFG